VTRGALCARSLRKADETNSSLPCVNGLEVSGRDELVSSVFAKANSVAEAFLSGMKSLETSAMKSRIVLVLLMLTAVAVSVATTAAEVAASPTPPPAAVLHPDDPKSFDPAAATQAWLDTVPAEKRKQSDAYFEGGYWLILWNFLFSAAILLFLLASGLSRRWRDWAERTRFKFLQVAIYSVLFILATLLLGFPLEFYQNFYREHQYQLSTQTFGSWMVDEAWGALVGLIGGAIALGALYAVFRKAPRLWWALGVVVVVVLLAIGQVVGPVFISPLFNKYTPITDPAIREPILALARANEIPVDQVYQFDASRQTNRVSANVSGAFGTTRISLNDNLLKQCSMPEIRQVMSHEMGHYVLNHSVKLLEQTAFLIFFGFLFARIAFDWSVRRWGNRWGVRDIADPAGFPLLALIFAFFSFLATPLNNSIIRTAEREADAFGINASGEPDGMAQVSLKLGTYRKLNPGPIEEMIFFDHPSGRARIRMAMDWKSAHSSTAK
jgi:STE24 endopeptidase